MSDVGRKTVPDKECLNRERPVTKAFEFPFCAGKSFFHRNWNGEYEMECTQRDRMTDMVAGYHQRNERQRWLLEKYPFFYWEPVNVVNMLCHRQGSVNVNPEAFDMAFERNIMTANSQMAVL